MASIHCAIAGTETAVFESNTAAGRKLLLTGGGRCNLTHLAGPNEIARAFGPKGRFLKYSLHEFTPEQVCQFFRELGVETRVEPDGCVFPASDRASDVRDCLINRAKSLGVQFYFDKPVKRITRESNSFAIHTASKVFVAEKVIIATGGLSYPQTGSTGNGYKFAKELGHTIIETKASLVPLVACEDWPRQLAGTAIPNVKITTRINNKKIATAGALVFTDDGIGGPAVLDLSWLLADYLPAKKPIEIFIDLVPAMNDAEFDEYLLGLFAKYPKKIIVNVLYDIVPKKIAGFLCRWAGIEETTGSQLKKESRLKITRLLKKLPLSIKATRLVFEATVTRGGVSVDEIETKTMESKICQGLFFAGEVIDVDGPCGGYNLQLCWATGALAGSAAACKF
jgi:hypothetical protein